MSIHHLEDTVSRIAKNYENELISLRNYFNFERLEDLNVSGILWWRIADWHPS